MEHTKIRAKTGQQFVCHWTPFSCRNSNSEGPHGGAPDCGQNKKIKGCGGDIRKQRKKQKTEIMSVRGLRLTGSKFRLHHGVHSRKERCAVSYVQKAIVGEYSERRSPDKKRVWRNIQLYRVTHNL